MKIVEVLNRVRFDDMGYPLVLCKVNNNDKIQTMWIDADEKWADKEIEKGNLIIDKI